MLPCIQNAGLLMLHYEITSLWNHQRILPTIWYSIFKIITSSHWVPDNHWIIIIFIIYHFMIYYWKGLKLFSLPSFTKKWDPPWVSQIATPIMVLCWTWANDLGAKWPNCSTNLSCGFSKWLWEKLPEHFVAVITGGFRFWYECRRRNPIIRCF